MKALVLTSLYPNNISPSHGVFIKERMRHVAKLDGCHIKVVAPVPYFPPLKVSSRWRFSQVRRHEIIDGLEVFHPRYFITPKVGMTSYGLTMFLSLLPLVKRIQRDFDFDVIDSHFVYPDGFAAILLGRVLRRPVVVSARGSDINLYAEFPLIRRLLRYTLRQAHKVIAVSRALKEAMMRLGIGEEKIAVIPNGVDLHKFYPFPKEEARRQLGLPHGRVLLSVGNLLPLKGFDLFIKAFKILLDERRETNLHLVIVGEGEARRELSELVVALNLDDRVRLVGEVAHDELYRWYSAADLFCLLSSREGWPNVLLEALACGTPVVATAVGGIPEIMSSRGIGLLTQRSAPAIAAAMAVALDRAWDAKVIRHYAREHTWDRAALAIFRIFASVLEPRQQPRAYVTSGSGSREDSHA
ncbi:MAG: glycosyltransferase family 4 protein [Candidatus Entotheonellia bacterium]